MGEKVSVFKNIQTVWAKLKRYGKHDLEHESETGLCRARRQACVCHHFCTKTIQINLESLQSLAVQISVFDVKERLKTLDTDRGPIVSQTVAYRSD